MIDSAWTPKNTIRNFRSGSTYTTFSKGTTYYGEAYSQNNPQESWSEFYNLVRNTGGGTTYYGNDCSGFVSIAWKLPARYTTSTIEGASSYVTILGQDGECDDVNLLTGDACNRNGSHIILFDYYSGSGGIQAMEQTPTTATRRYWSWSSLRYYRPLRRKNLRSNSCVQHPPSTCSYDVLPKGGVMWRGDHLYSCDGRFWLSMQTDGNLVWYQRSIGALWASHTGGSGADRAIMQTDGNLVVYKGGTPKWASGSSYAGSYLAAQEDGNLVVYGGGRARWATNTFARVTPNCSAGWIRRGQTLSRGQTRWSCDSRFYLAMQTDGNLVLYKRNAGPLWASHTDGSGADRAIMQTDGNLVVYKGGTPKWASGTSYAGSELLVQTDGNLVIYGGGSARWATNTYECR